MRLTGSTICAKEDPSCPKSYSAWTSRKSMRDQAVPGHNRWHPDIPAAAMVRPGDRVPGRVPGVDRRPDRQQRLGQRRTRRRPDPCAHAERPDRRRGRRAGRPARRRHPRPGPGPPAGRRRPGPGLGLHRHLRQGERRRLPDRLLPRRLQGDLGLPRQTGDLPPPPGRPVTPASPTPGCSAPRRPPSCWPAGTGGSRPSSTPIRTGCRRWPCRRWRDNALAGTATGDLAEPDRRGRGPHGARPGERRQPRHQELHPRLPRLLPGARDGRQALRRRPALQPGRRRDHLLRRDRDGRLHRLPRRPHQGRHGEVRGHHQPDLHAGQRRAAVLGVPDVHRASRSTTTPTRTTTSTRRWPTAGPASTPSSTSRSSGYTGEQAYLLLGSAPIEGRHQRRSWTSRTRAARSTCRRRSSTSTSAVGGGTGQEDRGQCAVTS